MKKLFFLASIGFFIGFFLSSPALALSQADTKKFVDSMSDVLSLAAQMEKSGKNKIIDAKVRETDEEGKFSPYLTASKTLKNEFPDDYKELTNISKKHGFSGAEQWAQTGDRVIEAFIASEMGSDLLKQIVTSHTQMNQDSLVGLTDEERKRMKQGFAMLQNLTKVPPENIEAVTPYKAVIEDFMKEHEENNKKP